MDNPFSMEVDSGNVTQNPENMETSETTEDIKKKKTKATTSDVWRYFTKLGPGDDGIARAQCDGCKQKFKAGGKQYGTSSLKRHLDRCMKIDFEDIGEGEDVNPQDARRGGVSTSRSDSNFIDLEVDN
ncbi:hypothetical protein Ahy_B02g058492 [Arachis hypogaea]|uniref:BED-type domain-containing protein n=1 Tax=Arachis hypogaea TaxID=3818 RepID=A0A445AES0_ARAHY|nr:hypothetical protein Ahy_B02g058492 [Arachis hypogaea]